MFIGVLLNLCLKNSAATDNIDVEEDRKLQYRIFWQDLIEIRNVRGAGKVMGLLGSLKRALDCILFPASVLSVMVQLTE